MPRLSKIGAAALAAFGWTSGGGASVVTASYLVVAGGGSGGQSSNYTSGTVGGGGAGGYQTGTTSLNPTLSYTVVVGAGGAAVTGTGSTNTVGNNGSNSQFGALTASVGGGYGGYQSAAGTGGSGGGAGYIGTAGSGTSGQGNNGGSFTGTPGPGNYAAAGGGGAGAVGGSNSGNTGGNGGAGSASSISGSSVTYAGGGGAGGALTATAGSGGSGGGGAGGAYQSNGVNGTANTGGGGGASGAGNATNTVTSGAGGSGVVIISYAGAQQFGGGIVTSVGGNTIHTFNTSGTLSPINSLTASYLIVAGGGSGGLFGGGGAGGMLTGSGVTIDTNSNYVVTVGAGGSSSNGGNSVFSIVATTAVGGGGSSSASGGSGAGGLNNDAGGAGTSGQGNNGGQGKTDGATYNSGGGGGGAGAVGGNSAGNVGSAGIGGIGLQSSISGSATYYAGGGGGGGDNRGVYGNYGGTGGGGAGGTYGNSFNGQNATTNTGGGGGGAGYTGSAYGNRGNGGSGIVIISYAGSTQQMAGGTVTIVGGNVIHTFTTSGYLTPLTFVGNSLRYRSSASANLTRTPTIAGNQKTWTFSAWIKRGTLGSAQSLLNTGPATSSDSTFANFGFGSGDVLNFQAYSVSWRTTTQVFRDPAAWYHIVLAFDTTQSVAANRIKLYVNGTQVTAFTTSNDPTQNTNYAINQAAAHYLSYPAYSFSYFDGYMANVQFVDGQALAPTAFGTFNSYGVWQPINYGGSYGTNGFYLPFTRNNTYAASFNGSSQYLTLPSSSGIGAFGTGDFTIECWVNPASYASVSSMGGSRTPAGTVNGWNWGVLTDGSFQMYSNSPWVNSGAGTVPLNTWTHVAITRSGGTLRSFVNGVQKASATDTENYTLATYWVGVTGGSAEYFNGSISNYRVVKGTALYTSNFTITPAPFTAVTNTALLTLQNATIIDNSTNAYTITNTGSVTPYNAIPYINYIAVDNSPAGNNWAGNNFGASGSTYDSMTDVPTLTSATAANYAVFNPLDQGRGSFTTSNGNLQFTATGTNASAATTMYPTTGKWYCEMIYTTGGGSYYSVIGVIRPNTTAQWYQSGGGVVYSSQAQYDIDGAGYVSYGVTWNAGDVLGIALNLDSGTVTFYVNGSSQGAITLPSSTNGWTFFMGDSHGGGGSAGSANFGQQPFKYTPPSGFVALNTYNL